jgi:hypothetical protein
VIAHNPLPDLTHADFVQLLGPLLAPAAYAPHLPTPPPSPSPGAPPMDWLHVDAKSARTARADLAGLASLAAERGWRRAVVLSADLARLPPGPDTDAVRPSPRVYTGAC